MTETLLTGQSLFDFVAKHLLTQNQWASNDGDDVPTGCRYRLVKDDRVLKCAAGCLIKDEHYRPTFEGVIVMSGSSLWDAIVASGVENTLENVYLVKDLQKIHDYDSPKTWKNELQKLAKERGFSFSH